MRLPTIPAALLLSLLALPFASAKTTDPSGEFHTFYGVVKVVDLSAKTFTIQAGSQSFLFHYTDETKISSYHGYISWAKVWPGLGATVVMRLGEGNLGVAVRVRFEIDNGRAASMALFSARTIQGQEISGIAVSNYVTYEPKGDKFYRAIDLGTAAGILVASVQPDGTVGKVTPLKSLGLAEANKRAEAWVRKWKFRPNSVTEVRLPVGISRVW